MSTPRSGAGESFVARIGMWSAHHRRVVLVGWVALVVASAAICSSLPVDTDVNEQAVGGGDTDRATALIEERFPVDEGEIEGTAQEAVVFSHPTLNVDDPLYRNTVVGLMERLLALRIVGTDEVGGTTVTNSLRIVRETTSHYDLGLPREQSPFVAENETGGDVTFALVQVDANAVAGVDIGNILVVTDAVAEADGNDGFEILIGGEASLGQQLEEILNEDFARASVINLPVTLVILIIAFGALLAAFVPLLLGFGSIAISIAAIAIASQLFPQSNLYQQMVLLLGLATGIDYSLFVITRYRNEMRSGHSRDDALRIAMGTSGKAIVFAGSTTIFALAGMFLVGLPIFYSLAFSAQVVVVVAVLSAVTFLPALIATLGGAIDRLHVPLLSRLSAGSGHSGPWSWIVDTVLRRPVLPALVAIVGLLALTAPALTMHLGFNGPRSFPRDAEGTRALIALEEDFTLGLIQPAVVVVDAGSKQNVFASDIQAATARLLELVSADVASPDNPDALFGPIARPPEFNDAGDTGLLYIPVNGDAGEDRALDAVEALRGSLVPEAFDESSADAIVTGASAANIDFRDNIQSKMPIVFAFVLGLTFITLLLAFRSLVIAITAIVLNLFSVGVAYGLLVLVFQEGFLLEGLLGFEATGIIESWLPLFLFSLLFGLSIDYEMFVMGRIKEHYERGLSTDEAIAEGVKGTAGVISNAAAIMVAVALIFAFMRELGLKQFGFGLAMAILFDATVIRAFVLPTTMKLLGEWNWYLPAWLEWLPRLPMAEEVEPVPAPAASDGS